MSRRGLSHLVTLWPFSLGYRDPLSRAAGLSMGAVGEIPPEPDSAAASDPWRGGDKRGNPDAELDPRIVKIMEDVMRYIRNLDINTL